MEEPRKDPEEPEEPKGSEEEEPLEEPMDHPTVKKMIRAILENGKMTYSPHAKREMTADNLKAEDCINVLRGGHCEFEELEKGTWRYRITTPRICVLVAFRSRSELRIVSTWRIKTQVVSHRRRKK